MNQPNAKQIRLVTTIIVSIAVILAGSTFWYISKVDATAKKAQMYEKKLWISPVQSQKKETDFTLTDQSGKTVSLSQYLGKKAVILQFMDPKCTDICPIISQEILQANQLLGKHANHVAYVTVNVNEYHESKQDVLDFSQQHGLNQLPNWHFGTGTTENLKKIWKEYGINVIPNATGDVEHTSILFFIDKNGNIRYIAHPDKSQSSIPDWAKGISFFTKQIL